MITNDQKREFVESIIEKEFANMKNAEIQEEIFHLLLADTNNGRVYKYRTFNKHSLSNLRERTLYCSSPSAFNDPFDCKMGMDFQSIFLAKYGKDLEHISEYFERFIQLYDHKISIKDCTDNEKLIFDKWLNNKKLGEVIKKCRNVDITNAEMGEILFTNFDVILEVFGCCIDDAQFKKYMEGVKEYVLRVLSVVPSEQRYRIVDDNTTLIDYARVLGVTDDADEILLIIRMAQVLNLVSDNQSSALNKLLTLMHREIGEATDNKFRVGSLCTDYKNRLMWSHYADGHKGFCVEYDFSSICDELRDIIILPVIHSLERIKVPWEAAILNDKDNEDVKKRVERVMILSLLTKVVLCQDLAQNKMRISAN